MKQQTEKICFRYDGGEEAKEALKWVNETFDTAYGKGDGIYYYNHLLKDCSVWSLRPEAIEVPPAEFLRIVKGESEPKWKVGDECVYHGYRSKIIHIHDGMAWIFDTDQRADDKTENNVIVELHDIRPVRKSLREELHEFIKDAYNCFIPDNGIDRIIQLIKERREEL